MGHVVNTCSPLDHFKRCNSSPNYRRLESLQSGKNRELTPYECKVKSTFRFIIVLMICVLNTLKGGGALISTLLIYLDEIFCEYFFCKYLALFLDA